mgnify:CR=1 FL=1
MNSIQRHVIPTGSNVGESDEEFARRLQALENGGVLENVPSGQEIVLTSPNDDVPQIEGAPIPERIRPNQLSPRTIISVAIFLFWPQILSALIILPPHWDDKAPCGDDSRNVWKLWVVIQTVRIFFLCNFTIWIHSMPSFFEQRPLLKARVGRAIWLCEVFGFFWLAIGNIWLLGSPSMNGLSPCNDSYGSPIHALFLTMVILQFVQLLMPCILAVLLLPLICCCLPCIIRFLAHVQSSGQRRGATTDMIDSVPSVMLTAEHFKAKGPLVAAEGTDNDTATSTSAVEITCSICICDMHIGDEARLLPCKHFFHKAVGLDFVFSFKKYLLGFILHFAGFILCVALCCSAVH